MEISKDVLLPGDIVFVDSHGIIAKIIKLIQTAFKGFKATDFIPTHICIVVSGKGVIMESNLRKGVHINKIDTYFANKKYENRLRIMRNKKLEQCILNDLALADKYGSIMMEHPQQRYNVFGIFKKRCRKTKFCSELAVECLQKINVLPPDLISHYTFPLDLWNICSDTNTWREITEVNIACQSKR